MREMLGRVPGWLQTLVVLVLIGVGVLIWQAAPDSEPAVPDVPASTMVPASTEAPATSTPFTVPGAAGKLPCPHECDGDCDPFSACSVCCRHDAPDPDPAEWHWPGCSMVPCPPPATADDAVDYLDGLSLDERLDLTGWMKAYIVELDPTVQVHWCTCELLCPAKCVEVGDSGDAGCKQLCGDQPPCVPVQWALDDARKWAKQAILDIEALPDDQERIWKENHFVDDLNDVIENFNRAEADAGVLQPNVCGAVELVTAMLDSGYPVLGTDIANSLLSILDGLAATGEPCAQP